MDVIVADRVSKLFMLRHNYTPQLKVRVLSVFHREKRHSVEPFWAVRDVSFGIAVGEVVGIVGRNGSGKSTLLKMVAGLQRPTRGHLFVARRARVVAIIELGAGFHPELTGRENVYLEASIYGFDRRQIEAIYPRIVAYSGLEQFMDLPLKGYSSGMAMRLGFSVAAHLDPDILLLDEVFAVGDADFKARCVETLLEFRARGKTILFVSHSADAVRELCSRVCVLQQGQLTFDGPTEEGLAWYEQSIAAADDAMVRR
ncbi:MAG: ABC transporter ATP-binding protein [Acidobacteria bacterium]|nr:ABC transporter ATP-binding protein [Acidobacteriota bacterium]